MKDTGTSSELGHEHSVELVKVIRVAGKKEKNLNSAEKEVVAVMRDLVLHLVEGKSPEVDYFWVAYVGDRPVNSNVMLFADTFLKVFDGEDCFHFRPEDLDLELAQITRNESKNESTIFNSLSGGWRLTGLNEKEMNASGIDGQGRIKLLEAALTTGRLRIRSTGSKIVACSQSAGPIIIGKKL